MPLIKTKENLLGFRNWMRSEFWKPKECSLRTTTTHQAKPQMDSTPSSSNNEDKDFDQDKFLEEVRDQTNEQFQPEAEKALADLRKAADAIVKRTVSEHQQLGLIRDAADDLNLGNQPDDALRELLDEAREVLNADDSHDIDGGQRFTVRRGQLVMPGFIKQGALHLINAEQGAGKSCFC